jgi:class 3 adenylate cyclase
MSGAPEGLIAMLFTDVEGSTRLASSLGDGWANVLADHHEIVAGAVRSHGGWIDGVAGDGDFVTFDDARLAARAAVAAQRGLRDCSSVDGEQDGRRADDTSWS